jgi:hypothetical protein
MPVCGRRSSDLRWAIQQGSPNAMPGMMGHMQMHDSMYVGGAGAGGMMVVQGAHQHQHQQGAQRRPQDAPQDGMAGVGMPGAHMGGMVPPDALTDMRSAACDFGAGVSTMGMMGGGAGGGMGGLGGGMGGLGGNAMGPAMRMGAVSAQMPLANMHPSESAHAAPAMASMSGGGMGPLHRAAGMGAGMREVGAGVGGMGVGMGGAMGVGTGADMGGNIPAFERGVTCTGMEFAQMGLGAHSPGPSPVPSAGAGLPRNDQVPVRTSQMIALLPDVETYDGNAAPPMPLVMSALGEFSLQVPQKRDLLKEKQPCYRALREKEPP